MGSLLYFNIVHLEQIGKWDFCNYRTDFLSLVVGIVRGGIKGIRIYSPLTEGPDFPLQTHKRYTKMASHRKTINFHYFR